MRKTPTPPDLSELQALAASLDATQAEPVLNVERAGGLIVAAGATRYWRDHLNRSPFALRVALVRELTVRPEPVAPWGVADSAAWSRMDLLARPEIIEATLALLRSVTDDDVSEPQVITTKRHEFTATLEAGTITELLIDEQWLAKTDINRVNERITELCTAIEARTARRPAHFATRMAALHEQVMDFTGQEA